MKTPQELLNEEEDIFLSDLEAAVSDALKAGKISSLGGSVAIAVYHGQNRPSFLQELHPQIQESAKEYFKKYNWSSHYKYYSDGPSMSIHRFVLHPW